MKILIVDDEDEICDYLMTFLKEYSSIDVIDNIDVVPSGEKAIECINNKKYDLIFVDLKLARRVTGVEVVKNIRESLSKAFIIVMSGCMDDDLKKKMSEFEVDEYFSKPFDLSLEQLEEKLIPILKKYQIN